MRFLAAALLVTVPGLRLPVEILRDKWGVPHIYAQTQHDLFFAQGWITAKDRLFQIDLWRRTGTGKLAEVLGPSAIPRDRIARLVRFRGNWDAEWRSYSPDAREIAAAFTAGINAYIASLGGKRPPEFEKAGYDPGLWQPEDCAARMAGLIMTHNLASEVARAGDIREFTLPIVQQYLPPDPNIPIAVPKGLDLADITPAILRDYQIAAASVDFPAEQQGSNNWVVDGSMTVTGKPILANDPHRPVILPSLRKTVHLVGPGWNAIGAGEPALPGIALGHNDNIAFGFTIVGIDQEDLYVEKLNPKNPDEYSYRGAWKRVETEKQPVAVKGSGPQTVELRYTIHGPLIYEDRARSRAYALRWVGAEPGGAGYLAALAVSRAKNWREFLEALKRYKTPSENMVYADRDGNIGWRAAGIAPVRANWSGLLPVPGDSGEFEWSGYLAAADMPVSFNPASHFIATANHNILPKGYTKQLSYEWAAPYRARRIEQMLGEKKKYSIEDFERMQQDVLSLPAQRFQAVLKRWQPSTRGRAREIVDQLLAWDARVTVSSPQATVFEVWIARLPLFVFGSRFGQRTSLETLLAELETKDKSKALAGSLTETLKDLDNALGPRMANWTWGGIHTILFRHPLNVSAWNRGPLARPGDAQTVNATGGSRFRQSNGASYRQILDVADWDRSVMTNTPGESGDPSSPHYSDLLDDWAAGRYHPLPFTRKAVEAATVERLTLSPRR